MPAAERAVRIRARRSPPASHRSPAATEPTTLRVTPALERAFTRSTLGADSSFRFQRASAAIASPALSMSVMASSTRAASLMGMSTTTRAQTRVRLDATPMSPLGTMWTVPSKSRSTVRRRPRSSTVPVTAAMVTMSPRPYWFSARMKAPATMSLTRLCAPRATPSPTKPRPAIAGPRSTSKMPSTAMAAMPRMTTRATLPPSASRVRRRLSNSRTDN